MAFARVRPTSLLGGLSIRARVAILATLLALGCLGLLGYVQLSSLSTALTRATQEQSVLGTRQLASSIAGLNASIVSIIPADRRGLDGLIVFDANGDRLTLDMPPGAMTEDLRAGFIAHKATLLAMLRTPTAAGSFVTLKGGLTVPFEVLTLVWALETRVSTQRRRSRCRDRTPRGVVR